MSEKRTRARLLGRTGDVAGITHVIEQTLTLGRSAENDVVVNSPYLSGRHARIFLEDGDYFVEDLGSRNGTRVDGVGLTRPARLERLHVISLADVVDFVFVQGVPAMAEQPGPAAGARAAEPPARPTPASTPEMTRYDISFDTLIDPRAASMPAQPAVVTPVFELVLRLGREPERTFALKPGDNTLGRASDCDVTLPDPDRWLSRVHAVLHLRTDGARVSDRGTMNGTYVGGERVDSAELKAGATFRLGPFHELTLVQR